MSQSDICLWMPICTFPLLRFYNVGCISYRNLCRGRNESITVSVLWNFQVLSVIEELPISYSLYFVQQIAETSMSLVSWARKNYMLPPYVAQYSHCFGCSFTIPVLRQYTYVFFFRNLLHELRSKILCSIHNFSAQKSVRYSHFIHCFITGIWDCTVRWYVLFFTGFSLSLSFHFRFDFSLFLHRSNIDPFVWYVYVISFTAI